MYDILIKNGTIIDGSGKPGFIADVAIKGDKIVKIGELHEEKGDREIDALGKIVSPGFIDVDNHSDTFWQLFLNPDLESLVYQGVTTIIGGVCGSSLAPLVTPAAISSIQKWVNINQINFDWLSLGEYLECLSRKNIALNYGTLIGHSTLRRGVLGDSLRNLNPKEMKFIEKNLKRSMKEGGLGLSSGLVYSHAHPAPSEEILNLAKIIKSFDGIYVTHIRDESAHLVESVEEAIKIAKESGVKSHISHLKAMGSRNWPKMEESLEILSRARKEGIEISFDIYPYTSTGSVLYSLLPSWVSEGGKKLMLTRLRDKDARLKVVAEMKESEFEYEKIEIASSPIDKTLTRRRLSEIALAQGKEVEEAVIDILLATEGRAIVSMEVLSEDNVRKSIAHPLSIIASNGAGYGIKHSESGELIHPRSFGTFSRVLAHYVRSEKILSLEEAVRKMTSFPASQFGIQKRGTISEGFFADIAIFDKEKVDSLSTKENPYQYSKGFEYVLVNGSVALRDGKYVGEKNGKIIKR